MFNRVPALAYFDSDIGNRRSAEQEVQYVHSTISLRAVQFREPALPTANGDEPLILDVKKLCEIATGSLELVTDVLAATTFLADILTLVHPDLLDTARTSLLL